MKLHGTKVCVVALGLFGLLLPAQAHHGVSAYDAKNPVTLKGTVTGFEWLNPHSQIHIDVTDDKGTVVHWSFETQPPNILIHAGWIRNSLKTGDQITIVANPAKNGAPIGIVTKVILANGQELTATEK